MFRHFAEAQSVNHIEQIKSNAAIIQAHHSKHSLSSKLALLINAIEKFEKHSAKDYLTNDNSRAMLVIHAANVYCSHYEKHLLHSSLHFEATNIFLHLSHYLESVIQQMNAVNADLDKMRLPLAQKAKDDLNRLTAARYRQKLEADMRNEMLNELLLKTVEMNGLDYFGVTDHVFQDTSYTSYNEAQFSETAFDHAHQVWVNSLFQPEASLTAQLIDDEPSPDSEFVATVEFDLTTTEEVSSDIDSDNDETVEVNWFDINKPDATPAEQVSYDDDNDDTEEDLQQWSRRRTSEQDSSEDLTSSNEQLSLLSPVAKSRNPSPLFARRFSNLKSPLFSRVNSPASGSDSEIDSGYSSGEMQPLLPRRP